MKCLRCIVRKNRGLAPIKCDCGNPPSLRSKVSAIMNRLAAEEIARNPMSIPIEKRESRGGKLSRAEKARLVKLAQTGVPYEKLAEKFGISRQTIYNTVKASKNESEAKKNRHSLIFASPHKEAWMNVRRLEAGL